jgi:transcription initiation factor TFIIIB Brf1 subunit/transcription initiation factor TFIIB
MTKTTKICPKCGNTNLVMLSTLNQKRCTDCGEVIKWKKEKHESDYI